MNWSAFVGLPWQDRGRGPGYDCWGLLIAAFAIGTSIELPSHADEYATAADRADTAAVFAGEVGDWTEVEDQRSFDVAVLRIQRGLHVGLVVRRGLVLHMPRSKTSVIEPLDRYRPVIEGIYRHKRLM